MLRRRADEVRQLMRAPLEIVFVKNPLGESAEESRHSVFEDLAARTEKRGGRINIASEWNKIMLISTRAMQKQQGSLRTARHEFVSEVEPRFHWLAGTLMAGRTSSICERVASSHAGRRNWLPNSSKLSSNVKPRESSALPHS